MWKLWIWIIIYCLTELLMFSMLNFYTNVSSEEIEFFNSEFQRYNSVANMSVSLLKLFVCVSMFVFDISFHQTFKYKNIIQ